MQESQLPKRILEFVREAGQLSLDLKGDLKISFKRDHSVLTAADRGISRLFHGRFGDLARSPEHLIIDEESEDLVASLDREVLDKAEYIWALDPIDGTRVYANGMPQFGVSLGILKGGRPWMGAVFFPVLRELFFCDGTKAFWASDAFTPDEKRRTIKPIDEPVSPRSVLFADSEFFRFYDWDYRDVHVSIAGVAVVDLCWPAAGRGCGAAFWSYLWDFAGAWPVCEAAGLKFRHIETGVVMDRIDPGLFMRGDKAWMLRDFHILSTEQNFEAIRSHLKARQSS